MKRLTAELELIAKKSNQSIFKELTRLDKRDQKDIGIYLESHRVHKELMNQYWPTSTLTNQEKLKRTANKVGFELPK